MNVEIGNEAAKFHSGNICFEFSVQCVCIVLTLEIHDANWALGLRKVQASTGIGIDCNNSWRDDLSNHTYTCLLGVFS